MPKSPIADHLNSLMNSNEIRPADNERHSIGIYCPNKSSSKLSTERPLPSILSTLTPYAVGCVITLYVVRCHNGFADV